MRCWMERQTNPVACRSAPSPPQVHALSLSRALSLSLARSLALSRSPSLSRALSPARALYLIICISLSLPISLSRSLSLSPALSRYLSHGQVVSLTCSGAAPSRQATPCRRTRHARGRASPSTCGKSSFRHMGKDVSELYKFWSPGCFFRSKVDRFLPTQHVNFRLVGQPK